MACADGRHHRQAAHRIERRADHAAVQALVRVVADQLGAHRHRAAHALGGEFVDLQAEDAVEHHHFLEEVLELGGELGFEQRDRHGDDHASGGAMKASP